MNHESRKEKLKPVVDYVQEQTGYLIYLKDERDGRLVTGTVKMEDVNYRIAFVYFKNCTEAIHELGHIWATPGPRPAEGKALLIHELEAWRCAESLHYKFGIPFDTEVFDEGLGSYVLSLVFSPDDPGYEWFSQLLGGEVE